MSIFIKSSRLRWAGHVARVEEGRSAFKILTGKYRGKILLGRLGRRWEDVFTMDLKEVGVNTRNLVHSAQDRDLLESPYECGIEPPGSISFVVS